MKIREHTLRLNTADFLGGFGIAIATLIVFGYTLLTNNNALNPYYLLYGPASIILNYQILWNNAFPQTLYEAGRHYELLKILSLIAVLWMAYWGSVFTFLISSIRSKKYRLVPAIILGIGLINYFSAKFQAWFIGMRAIM